MTSNRLELEPIGTIRSPFRERAEVPRQPRAAEGVRGRLELLAGRGFEDALQDISSWDHLWVLFWFHLAEGWNPKVLPPRSRVRRGLFATRAPHRPNPLGISAMRLVRVEGLVLHVENVDVVDGTPLLDLKPYVAWTDAIPDARGGWLEQEARPRAERPEDPGPRWRVRFAAQAEERLAFLMASGLDLRAPIEARLGLGPHPHAYRRIRRQGDRGTLALKAWRVDFLVTEHEIEVLGLRSGQKRRSPGPADAAEQPLHRLFIERFGDG
ncbi:MAG: tRNA (N6-threonylcarbamoyladenosine(37)-N6)-methyltransferase TrmO [Myxococcales bacterium]|nr:tRNA (N6-threonylcarbamoyladenosine(37)-N6)-methyltransferase TrmO [Myxococcales bacterium]